MKYIKEKIKDIINEKIVTYIIFVNMIAVIALGAAFAPKEITVYQGQTSEKLYTSSQTVGEAFNSIRLF